MMRGAVMVRLSTTLSIVMFGVCETTNTAVLAMLAGAGAMASGGTLVVFPLALLGGAVAAIMATAMTNNDERSTRMRTSCLC
jgi:uncharacterized protein (DUF697 family)